MSGPRLFSPADVRRALPMRDAITAMRRAFMQLALGQVTQPPRVRLDATGARGTALIMPCYSAAEKMFSVKMVTLYPDNASRGLPLIQATVLLTDGETGVPVAVLDGASLTAIRTGAASGLATDLLARPAAATLAVFGTGVQARTQMEAVCCVRPIRRVRVFGLDAGSAERFAVEMSAQLGVVVERAATAAAALEDAEVICTATTSTTPVFADCDVAPGSHINAIGSFRPDVAEIPAATVCRARVVVDQRAAALEEAGELIAPLRAGLIPESHCATELGDVVIGRAPGRSSAEQVTLFKSVGLAIQDLCAAVTALKNAPKDGACPAD